MIIQFLLGLLIFADISSAASPSIIIESVDIGSPGAQDEYIILKNTSSESIDISKWSIQCRTNGSATVQKKNLLPGTILAPQEKYIIAHKEGRFAQTAHMTYTTLNLVEKGGVVGLFSNTNYATTFEEPSLVSAYNYNSAVQPQTTTTPTTSTPQNSAKAITSSPEFIGDLNYTQKNWPIKLSELYPNPSTDDEYIELFNTSNEGVDVSGLWLKDASGVSYALGARGENTLFGAQEYRIWKRETTRIALNNTDGESILLFDQNGTIVDKTIYSTDAPEDVTYARLGNSWLWTTRRTPFEKNSFSAIESPPIARAVIPAQPITVDKLFEVSAVDSTDTNDIIVSYNWDFGDGTNKFGATSTHAYTATGTYTITLDVVDSYGAHDSVSRKIDVKNKEKITATGFELAAAPKKTPRHYYSGIVSVPPGVLSRRRFVVNGRTAEITTDRSVTPLLKRGSIVKFSGQEVFKVDRLLLQISAKDTLDLVGTTTAPPYTTLTGTVGVLEKNGFNFSTTSTDYLVLSGLRYFNNKKIEPNDVVEIVGVILTDDADKQTIVIPSASHIKLLHKQAGPQEIPKNISNILLLLTTTCSLIGIHLFLTNYGKHLSKDSFKKIFRQTDSQAH